MPRIPDEIQECVAYMYPDRRSATVGERVGGSAFLLMHHGADSRKHQIYVVTNAHVIENGHWTIRLNTQDGENDVIDTTEKDWFYRNMGDDVAIYPVKLDLEVFRYRCVVPHMFATKAQIEKNNIGIGDDCYVMGRFINHEGRQRNLPCLRFGNIAQMPWEKIQQDRIWGMFEQESFLVEARSISGYSGSPVFVYFDPSVPRPSLRPMPLPLPGEWRGPWLLGISWGYLKGERVPVYHRQPDNTDVLTKSVADTNSGMMGVVPIWKLEDLLNDERMVKLREARYAAEEQERGDIPR